MINLLVKFSPEYEIKRVKETLGKLPWYKEKGYKVRFPEKLIIDSETIVSDISENKIKEIIETEYDEKDYTTQKVFLLENWQKIIDEIFVEFSKTDLKLREIYTVNLTKYGVGGSYHYPDVIITNIKNSYNIGLLRTTFHEILHLIIHPWIIEYKVGHWQKERIVDLLIEKFIPRLSKPQQMSIKTEDIDKIFNDNYPNIEDTLKKMVC